jgi:RHS repeat-associated protein
MLLGFPGQYYDQETGNYYNYFRDYDPTTGRYLQSDPIGLGGGLNTYLYANADPIANTDPYGLTSVGMVFNPMVWGPPLVMAGYWMYTHPDAAQSLWDAMHNENNTDSVRGKTKKSAEEKKLNREKNRVCKSPDIITGDPCIDAKSRLERLQRCLELRKAYRDRFGDKHPHEITNAEKAVENAKNDVRAACGEEPECK